MKVVKSGKRLIGTLWLQPREKTQRLEARYRKWSWLKMETKLKQIKSFFVVVVVARNIDSNTLLLLSSRTLICQQILSVYLQNICWTLQKHTHRERESKEKENLRKFLMERLYTRWNHCTNCNIFLNLFSWLIVTIN